MTTTKEVITPETALSIIEKSCVALTNGYGSFEDFTRVTAALKFCLDKNKSNPSLGFVFELNQIKETLGELLWSVTRGREPKIVSWISPFSTIAQRQIINKLYVLLDRQYTNKVTLDPNDNKSRLYIATWGLIMA
jgi:hypothetical protein